MNVCTNRSRGTLELIYKRIVSLDRFAEFDDLCRKLKGIYFVKKKQLLSHRQELFLFWWRRGESDPCDFASKSL